MFLFALFLYVFAAFLSTSHAAFVKELDDSFVQQSKEGEWLVEFYAPWCGHCKRLEPVYEAVAKRLQATPITVGRIDCTKYSYAASHFSIRGFPTIQYFLLNMSHTHTGDRTEEGILEFVNKSQGPAVRKLSSVGRFNEAQTDRGNSPYFMYIGDDDPNNDLYMKYAELAEEFRQHSYFYKGAKKILPQTLELQSEPTVILFKDGKVWEYKDSEDSGTKGSLHDWVNSERFPAFPRTSGAMINEMARTGKFLVMVLVDMVSAEYAEDSQRIKRIADVIATQHRDKYHRKYQFLWLEDADIVNNIAMQTLPLPAILILDPAEQYYYIPTQDAVATMSLESFMTYLDDVTEGKIEAAGGTGFTQRVKRVVYEIYSFFASVWLASRIVFCLIIGVPSFLVGLLVWSLCCMADDEAPPTDDDTPPTLEKDLDEPRGLTEPPQIETAHDATDHAKSE